MGPCSRLACVALVLAAPTLALARVATVRQFGAWALMRGTMDDGSRMCGLAWGDRENAVEVKYVYGRSDLVLQSLRMGRNVGAQQRSAQLVLDFSGHPAWQVAASAQGHIVEADLAGDAIDRFLGGFTHSGRLDLGFPDGDVLSVSLDGAFEAARAMRGCIADMRSGG